MKIYKLPYLADGSSDGSYLLDRKELKTDSAYLRYARLRPFESDRNICPRDGCEEIIFVVKGSLMVKQAKSAFTVAEGEAFLSNGKLLVDNPNEEEAVYIAAGGCLQSAGRSAAPEAEPCVKPAETIPKPPMQGKDPEEFEITKDDGPDEGGK
ncbi:MAG: hypothetical protein HZB82_03330 [Deltaproteobacteria bacterium]|nr:hypothetical protein [Deltaproteobacteria bacterium]